MATSRKLYIAVAQTIKERRDTSKYRKVELLKQYDSNEVPIAIHKIDATINTLDNIANDLADIFAEDNPNFDNRRFFSACGLYDD